jgi:hypothetical protein
LAKKIFESKSLGLFLGEVFRVGSLRSDVIKMLRHPSDPPRAWSNYDTGSLTLPVKREGEQITRQ